ncbi:MAG: 5'/3'-nucleotidase SurE [Kiritimatiellae bacterium]|nr:5'/3'-nucleotidase SurE [Kiritimatiellia bacterium]
MNILVCNDDGIHAPGIRVLYDAVKDLGHVHVVAPNEEQSAVGHSITLFDPIKTSKVYDKDTFFGHAVGGTPTDCVKLASCALLNQPPDVVFSGINLGANTGINIIYSGTVSAATEAAILKIPSMAFSLQTFTDPHWDTAGHVARQLAKKFLPYQLPEKTLLNVNIPNIPTDQIQGYAVTPMAHSRFKEVFHKRTDPRGNIYYWLDGEMELLGDKKGTDIEAIENGLVSITPIGLDLTHYQVIDQIKKFIEDE